MFSLTTDCFPQLTGMDLILLDIDIRLNVATTKYCNAVGMHGFNPPGVST